MGFLSLERHGPGSAEIHVLAVLRGLHGRGVGTALVAWAEAWCAHAQVRWLHVKTRGPSTPDPGYERTRKFYLARGFEPLFETLDLWGPEDAALILVKPLGSLARPRRRASEGNASRERRGRLVLIGGPPGVGKTTLLEHLPGMFEDCACLDADDLWRTNPPDFGARHGDLWEQAVIFVLRAHLAAGYRFVFLAWVLAREAKIARIIDALAGEYEDVSVVHLTAERTTVVDRATAKIAAGLAPEALAEKLRKIDALAFAKLDTTALSPRETAAAIRSIVDTAPREAPRIATTRPR